MAVVTLLSMIFVIVSIGLLVIASLLGETNKLLKKISRSQVTQRCVRKKQTKR